MLEAGYFFFLIIKKRLYLSFVGLAAKKEKKRKKRQTTPSTKKRDTVNHQLRVSFQQTKNLARHAAATASLQGTTPYLIYLSFPKLQPLSTAKCEHNSEDSKQWGARAPPAPRRLPPLLPAGPAAHTCCSCRTLARRATRTRCSSSAAASPTTASAPRSSLPCVP